MNSFGQFLKTAVTSALKGGEIVRRGFHREKTVDYKSFANPVTEYDRESERVVADTILKRFPDHSILAEEGRVSEGASGVRWIIDPLDGTVNFTHRVPFVCVSVGVEADGVMVAGVIYNPILGELYTVVRGGGAFLNKKQIRVSAKSEPAHSLVVTGFPYELSGRVEILTRTLAEIQTVFAAFRRLGSAAMDLAFVARGSFESFYEENLKPWDTAAGWLLVEEAGGRVTDYSGNPYAISANTILASNGPLHNRMLSILKTVPVPGPLI